MDRIHFTPSETRLCHMKKTKRIIKAALPSKQALAFFNMKIKLVWHEYVIWMQNGVAKVLENTLFYECTKQTPFVLGSARVNFRLALACACFCVILWIHQVQTNFQTDTRPGSGCHRTRFRLMTESRVSRGDPLAQMLHCLRMSCMWMNEWHSGLNDAPGDSPGWGPPFLLWGFTSEEPG